MNTIKVSLRRLERLASQARQTQQYNGLDEDDVTVYMESDFVSGLRVYVVQENGHDSYEAPITHAVIS